MSNIDDILKKAQSAREADEAKQKKERVEKINRVLSGVAEKATGRVIGWLSKPDMKEGLKADIYDFFCEGVDDAGKPLEEYLLQGGVGSYFGKIGYEPIARKDYGPYILGLEESSTGNHYPYTLKIQNRADIRMAKILNKFLFIGEIAPNAINKILSAEEDSKVQLHFVDVETFFDRVKSKDGEDEYFTLNSPKEDNKSIDFKSVESNSKDSDIEAHAFITEEEILITRDDWYMGSIKVPKNPEFIFDMRYVYVPQH